MKKHKFSSKKSSVISAKTVLSAKLFDVLELKIKMPLEEAVENVLRGTINHGASMIGILLISTFFNRGKL